MTVRAFAAIRRRQRRKEDTRVTATVRAIGTGDEEDSPYIVQFEIQGSGEAGAAEGDTTLMAKVTRSSRHRCLRRREYRCGRGRGGLSRRQWVNCTRPPGLNEVEYRWDFGDGSEPATGMLGVGITTAVATHVYEHQSAFLVSGDAYDNGRE